VIILPRFSGLELLYVYSLGWHLRDAEPIGVVVLELPNMVSRTYDGFYGTKRTGFG
jgi:hypothetical protein